MESRSFKRLGAGGWGTVARCWLLVASCPAPIHLIFAALAVFAFIVGISAQTPDRARAEALARRATDRLQALQREADRLASEERTLLGDLRRFEIERQIRGEDVRRLDADAAKVAADLIASTARMQSLETAQRQSQPELRARLVELYKLGQARYLRMILSTPDLRHLGQ